MTELIEFPDSDFEKVKTKMQKIVERNRRYRNEHRDEHRKYMRELMKHKHATDPDFHERQLACKRASFKKIFERKKAQMEADGIISKPRGRPKKLVQVTTEIVV
jgi:hypothetical protein